MMIKIKIYIYICLGNLEQENLLGFRNATINDRKNNVKKLAINY